MSERERAGAEGELDTVLSQEPDEGLDPRTLGLSQPGVPLLCVFFFFFKDFLFIYLTERNHKQMERQAERERGKQAPR